MASFTKVSLTTGPDGRARFETNLIPLPEGSPASQLSSLLPATALQLRESPVGFRSAMHCSTHTQWVFILQGQMRIGLADGSSRVFSAGEHFYSADLLPTGAVFDPAVHGHWSAQEGELPLRTLFVRD
jgi:hypothetical protein